MSNCFLCNFFYVGLGIKMAVYAEGILKFEQYLSYFSQVDLLGFFEKILQSLVENNRKNFLVEIDLTFCKVHQDAAGIRKILGNQNIGVSRAGKTTKIHSLVNQHFLAGEKVLADKAFSYEDIRNFIFQEKAKVCIPVSRDFFNASKNIVTLRQNIRLIFILLSAVMIQS